MNLAALLVKREIVLDIRNACRLINQGAVYVNRQPTKEPLHMCDPGDDILVTTGFQVAEDFSDRLRTFLLDNCGNLCLDNDLDVMRATKQIIKFLKKEKLIE